MDYADILIAAAGALLLGWIADQATGRRGFGATGLVAVVGAACGWFLAVRVFAAVTMDGWTWVLWSLAGSALGLVVFLLFRSKR